MSLLSVPLTQAWELPGMSWEFVRMSSLVGKRGEPETIGNVAENIYVAYRGFPGLARGF